MAVTLQKLKVSINLSSVVSAAILSVKAVRNTEQAKQESAFQSAVAEGMSYSAQVQFRQKQLEDANSSSIGDPEYVANLTKSITDLKKLSRFQIYRAKYQSSLAELAAGKITAQSHLSMLQDQLGQTTDPDLQAEINTEITSANTAVKTYNDTIVANDVKRAQNDGSAKILNSTIQEVQDKRAQASLRGNEAEVAAYDNTLTALKIQLGGVQIEDALNSAQVTSITKGQTAFQKIDTLNSYVNGADTNTPIQVNNKRYASAQDFWMQLRDNYIAGNGVGIWKDAIGELSSYFQTRVNAAVARDGYATTVTLDSIKSSIDAIKNRPEFQPYLEQFNNLQSNALAYAFDSTAKAIVDRASFSGDFKTANDQLLNFSAKYGIDTETPRLQLANELTNQALQQKVDPMKLLKDTGLTPETFKTPFVPANLPAPTTLPTSAPGAGGSHTVVSGDSLSRIAQQNNTTVAKLIELNPQYKANPNLIKPGQSITLPGGSAAAAPAPSAPGATPAPAPTIAVPNAAPAPAPSGGGAPAPTPSSTGAASYSGASIVDFLSLSGKPTDFTSRSKLATQYGINNYTGTAAQNTNLLNILKAEAAKPAPTPAPTPAPSGGGGNPSPSPAPAPAPSGGGGSPSPSPSPSPRPNPTPAPTPAPTPPPAPKPQPKPSQSYVVKSGDSLSRIASQYGVSTSKISGYRSGNPNLIFPGEVLTINF